jgi:hypothetical protein
METKAESSSANSQAIPDDPVTEDASALNQTLTGIRIEGHLGGSGYVKILYLTILWS